MVIDNGNDWYVAFEPSLFGFLALVVAAGLLIKVQSAVRTLRSS